MPNKLGQLNCAADRKNSGFGSCVVDWTTIKGFLLYDNARSFTADEIEALQATLLLDASKDNKSLRMFPFHKFVAPTDNTEDIVIQTFDYGAKIVVREGDYDWTFQFVDGANCLLQSGRSHNGPAHLLFYDKDYKIAGYKKTGLLTTIPTQFVHFQPWKLATGSTVAQYMVRTVFETKYLNELGTFVKATFDPAEIVGLKDIEIVVNSLNQTTGVANVTLQTLCAAENLYDTYHAELDDYHLYSAVDQDGNNVPVTAAVAVASSKTFNITMTPASLPDSGFVYLSGPAPSVLAAAGVVGYEMVTAEIEIEGS